MAGNISKITNYESDHIGDGVNRAPLLRSYDRSSQHRKISASSLPRTRSCKISSDRNLSQS